MTLQGSMIVFVAMVAVPTGMLGADDIQATAEAINGKSVDEIRALVPKLQVDDAVKSDIERSWVRPSDDNLILDQE